MRIFLIIWLLLISVYLYAGDSCYEDVHSIASNQSFSTFIPNFEKFKNRLFEMQPSVKKYIKEYHHIHGVNPTVEEALNFYVDASDKMSKFIRKYKGHNNDLDHFLEIAARSLEKNSNVEKRHHRFKSKHGKHLTERLDINNRQHRDLIKAMQINQYKGVLGELDAVFRFKNVYAQGVLLKQMYTEHGPTQEINNILTSALNKRFENINEKELLNLMNKFPFIFKKKHSDKLPTQILEIAKNFIKSKELDLIIRDKDKFMIVEVKNYRKGLNYHTLVNSGRKSLLDQQKEMLEILEFLKLKDRFTPAFYSVRGITDKARKELESIGITVIEI